MFKVHTLNDNLEHDIVAAFSYKIIELFPYSFTTEFKNFYHYDSWESFFLEITM